MRSTTQFRRLVEAPEMLVLPGVADALGARIAAECGARAIVCGGYAATATLLGKPDTSLLGMAELADHYARLVDASGLPVFADGDTGFGNVSQVARMTRAYERAGVAGFFIEDQVFPKRCGHMAGKAVVPAAEMVARLKAALDARVDGDLVIMARTDANAVEGFEAALERAHLYREAGADALFVEAPRSEAELARVPAALDAPCMVNNIEGGLTPLLPPDRLAAMGYAISVFAVTMPYAMARVMRRVLSTLLADGTSAALSAELVAFDDFNALVGLPEVRAAEARLADATAAVVGRRR